MKRAARALPAVTVPTDPKQLRRLAIYNNYRALVDVSPLGGYGTLYGPNVTADGSVTADEGRIAGTEYLAFADRGRGRQNVTLMVQVPASFDPARASSPARRAGRAASTARSARRANGG